MTCCQVFASIIHDSVCFLTVVARRKSCGQQKCNCLAVPQHTTPRKLRTRHLVSSQQVLSHPITSVKSSFTADSVRNTHLRYYPIGYYTYTCIYHITSLIVSFKCCTVDNLICVLQCCLSRVITALLIILFQYFIVDYLVSEFYRCLSHLNIVPVTISLKHNPFIISVKCCTVDILIRIPYR